MLNALIIYLIMFLSYNNNNNNGGGKLLEINGYIYGIDCVMYSWMYTYLQTHPVVYIKYVQLFVCQSCLNKVV